MSSERKATPLPALPAEPRTRYRTLFLSDIHLGTRGCQARRLLDFLDHHDCDELYLVGDIVDGWRLKSGFYWPQEHTQVLKKFLALAESGTRVTYVTGNHDEFLRRYSDLEVGNVRIVDEAVHEGAAGARFLVTHGDAYDVVTRYHRWLAFLGDVGYGLLLEANRVFNSFRKRFGYGYFSLSAWVKHRVKQAVSYISDYERAVSWTCRQRDFAGVVCGHIHHAEIADYDGVRYMNCGDWVESCTALAEHADGRFEIVRAAPAPAVPARAGEVVAAAPPRLRLARRASG
jgi:UDP-2,3-diacylglucosamine pyrophosphatase LpxH